MRAYVFLAEGFEEIEAVAPVDALRRGGVGVTTVGVGARTVAGAHGIPVVCDVSGEDAGLSDMDMMILPGGIPGTENLAASPVVSGALRHAERNGLWIAAICAAPRILGEHGLLRGRRYTCYPGCGEDSYGGICTGTPLERDGRIITASGPGSAVAFGLALLEILAGEEKAAEAARSLQARF